MNTFNIHQATAGFTRTPCASFTSLGIEYIYSEGVCVGGGGKREREREREREKTRVYSTPLLFFFLSVYIANLSKHFLLSPLSHSCPVFSFHHDHST